MFARAICSIVIASSVVGCGVEGIEEGTAPPEPDVIARAPCPDYVCGGNSPVVDTFPLHHVDQSGAATEEGFAITGFYKNGVRHQFRVTNGKISARAPNNVIVSGQGLVGMRLIVERRTAAGVSGTYTIQIAAVGAGTDFWAIDPANPNFSPKLETYKLMWEAQSNPTAPLPALENLCSQPPAGPTAPGAMPVENALVYEGDVYDDPYKVSPVQNLADVTIGCTGHLFAKMQLSGYTGAAARIGFPATTTAERTAAMKMFAADYCGDLPATARHSFTRAGQPLNWGDDHGLIQIPVRQATTNATLEARWDEHGARCLNIGRVDAHPTPDFPNGLAPELAAAGCAIPACTNLDMYDLDAALVISVNPP